MKDIVSYRVAKRLVWIDDTVDEYADDVGIAVLLGIRWAS